VKILQVIHGYPMRYNAGSEVYTQTLCHGLATRHEVHVFTREEDPFAPDFALRREPDADDPHISLHVINVPRSRDRYRHTVIDQRFATLLDELRPDVVHIGHLNHLSTSLVGEAAVRGVPVVYTLHDYWVMCPRGQFMQMHPEDPNDLWAACDGQVDRKCAERCYARYFSGAPDEQAEDVAYWERWVARRMKHLREVVESVDLFVAPSQYLYRRYRDEFGLPEAKLRYLDYGFDLTRLRGRVRAPSEPFTFGYIGTHIPAKGIHHLIEAFARVHGSPRLRIWGRPHGQETEALRELARSSPGDVPARIEWLPEYRNQAIVRDVFDRVDAIVVPSIWVENSPLVIHEAQQARVPVITADVGGMAEYVHHEVNGLLYAHRSSAALAAQMQRVVDDPALARTLGARGYVHSATGDIPDIATHVEDHERLYAHVVARRATARVDVRPGPWRITFDTNPDTCNLKCVMCEEHSPHSLLQVRRKAAGRPRREMPIDLLRRIVAEAVPRGLREIIPSTMGEPLLYDDFEQIIEICRAHKVMLNLTTNGTFPRLGASAWAEKLVPVTSDVKISWNAATRETHEHVMIGSDWERAVANVRAFVAVRDAHAAAGGNRCRITFQLTFLDSNVDELAAIVRLAAELGVDRVKGHHVWAHFAPLESLSMRRSPDAIRRWNTAVGAAQATARTCLLPDGRSVLLENMFPLEETATGDLAPGGPCPFLGQEAWVSAAGRFDPCCAPDAQRRTLGDFGDLHGDGLLKIWDGEPYRRLVETYRNRALCLGCNMRRPAGGAA
jgi:glycosyltransferase involved in cell wall biosynthesis/wyosine [tRNA(Phe)-imidazoG37] synthetase (radical SAM superfamily)